MTEICPECGDVIGRGLALFLYTRTERPRYVLTRCAKCHGCGHTPGLSGFCFRQSEENSTRRYSISFVSDAAFLK